MYESSTLVLLVEIGRDERIENNEEIWGPVNVVAPEVISNKDFTKTVSDAVAMPAFIPVPGLVIKLILGEMGTTLMLSSMNCRSKKLLDSGFEFKLPTLKECLNEQLNLDSTIEEEGNESGSIEGSDSAEAGTQLAVVEDDFASLWDEDEETISAEETSVKSIGLKKNGNT
ncbi:MAG: DUF1731 domain-containing protein [Lentisphaeraceae bacterium]|nr:DUF1731 domain-containing protein [Lentisphaeraceae bacterium]